MDDEHDQRRDRSRSRDRGDDNAGRGGDRDGGGGGGGDRERERGGDREEEHQQQKNNDKSNLYITNLNHQVIVFTNIFVGRLSSYCTVTINKQSVVRFMTTVWQSSSFSTILATQSDCYQ